MKKAIDKINLLELIKKLGSVDKVDLLRSFFNGKYYPIWVAISVLLGRVTGLELYFAMFDFVIVAVALLLCDSLRPLIPNLISFLYRISLEHGPGVPNYSTYYSGAKVVVFFAFGCIFFASLIYFCIRNKIFSEIGYKKTPLLIPLSILSLSFLTGGAFTDGWSVRDLGFASLQVFVFAVMFLLLYFGLRREKAEEFCDYFVYVCAVVAVVLCLEVLDLYLSVDGVIANGSIDKDKIYFGWGIPNTCGGALSVLIPICFLGAMKSKRYHYVYYIIATLTMIATALTLSRNAVLIGSVFYIVCVVLSCFFGDENNKKVCRISTLSLAVILFVVCLAFSDEIATVFVEFKNKGFDNNGRFYLWEYAWNCFKSSPVFGIGFFSYDPTTYVASDFTPRLAHNTLLQLLSSMGVFGLGSYLVYRGFTLAPFFKKPRFEKIILMLSEAVLVGESLLDNFIFWFSPTFVYNIIIVIAFMYCEQENEKKNDSILNTDDPIITL